MGSSGKMLVKVLVTLASIYSTCLAVNRGSIQVEGYGEVWVISPDWANVQVSGNAFTLYGNSRMYFASRPTDGFEADAYWQIPLNNKEFAYSVDVSNVDCHCNAAAYFVDMPGNNPGAGDYYCDANFGNSIWCPEYDTFEGNKHTLAGTLHTCDGSPGNWNGCDRNGCQTNIYNLDSNAMCPESRCTINTNNWYQLVHTQNNDKSNIWVEQDGREYSFEICNDGGYRSRMAQSYDNMVWSGSLWGGGGIDMSWLDGMTGCWGDCNIDGSSVTFSNFRLTDEGAVPTTTTTTPAPTPGPTTAPAPTTAPPPAPTTTADHSCPGGSLAGCISLCPDEPADMYQDCVNECINICS